MFCVSCHFDRNHMVVVQFSMILKVPDYIKV